MAGPDSRSRTPLALDDPSSRPRAVHDRAARRGFLSVLVLCGILSLAAPQPARAQLGRARLPTFDPWRVTGELFLGYDWLESEREELDASRNSSLGLGFDLNLHGHAFDPRFLTFDIGGGFQAIGNDVNEEDFSTRLTNVRVAAHFLRERPWPFTFTLLKSDSGNRSDLVERFNTELDFLTLGLNWRLVLPDKPTINVSYDRSWNSSEFITPGLRGVKSHVRTLAATVSDLWRQWALNGRFFDAASDRELAGGATTESERRRFSFSGIRPFATESVLQLTAEYVSSGDALDGAFAGRGDDFYFNGSVDVRHSLKLRGNYFYGFRHSELDFLGAEPGLTLTRSFSSHDTGGQLSYQLTDRLALLGSATASLFPMVQGDAVEEARALYRLAPGVAYQHAFRYFNFGGSYEAVWNAMETTLENLSTAWSHVVTLSAGGGERSVLYASALYQYSDVAQVTFLGSFNRQIRFRLTLESQALRPLAIRAGFGRTEYDVLNINGENLADGTSWDVSVDHPRFGAGVGRRSGAGESFAFASPVERRGRITEPLPIDTLLTSPFAARDSLQDFAYVTFRPSVDFRVTARYRKDRTFFTLTPDFFTEEWNVFAEYRLQRFRFVAGYLDWDILTGPQRIRTQRFYFRVSRSFDFIPFL